MKKKIKQYLKIPSQASYAWAVDLYVWLFALLITLLVISRYGKSIHLGAANTDIILLLILFVTAIFSIAAIIQISYNLIRYKRERPHLEFKNILINVILFLGLAIFIYFTAFGD